MNVELSPSAPLVRTPTLGLDHAHTRTGHMKLRMMIRTIEGMAVQIVFPAVALGAAATCKELWRAAVRQVHDSFIDVGHE
jgi:hypothetical protein